MSKLITVRALRTFTYRNNTYRRGDLVAMQPIDIAVRGRKGDVSREKLSTQALKTPPPVPVQETAPPSPPSEPVQDAHAPAPATEQSPTAQAAPEPEPETRRRRYRRRDLVADDPQAEPEL
jgi:hypothetical protein